MRPPSVDEINLHHPVRLNHPQANGLLGYWPTAFMNHSGDFIPGFFNGRNAAGVYQGLSYYPPKVIFDPLVGRSINTPHNGGYYGDPSFHFPGGAVTVCFWIYVPTSPGKSHSPFRMTYGTRFSIECPHQDGWFYFDYGGWAGGNRVAFDFSGYYDRWIHVATYNSGSDRGLWIDGVNVLHQSGGGNNGAGSGVQIGRGLEGLQGASMADLRIYGRVLDGSEVESLYLPGSRWDIFNVRHAPRKSFFLAAAPSPSGVIFRRRPGIIRIGSRRAG